MSYVSELADYLADYQVTFKRDALFGLWTWRIRTPGGETLEPMQIIPGFIQKEQAESSALRAIEIHRATEMVTGAELAARIDARDKNGSAGVPPKL